jgi:cytochrome c556
MRLTADANKFGLFAFMAAVLITAAIVSAEEDVVAIRQADMKAMAAAAKTIYGMFKDPATYRASEFKWAADTIRDRSGSVISAHFASEADNRQEKAGRQSKAGPNILEERDRFDRLANDLRDYAVALDAAAEKNPGPMSASMRMKAGEAMGGGPFGTHVRSERELSAMPAEHAFHLMLQTCTTCHTRFRTQ